MIEPIMFFGLGFLAASLLGLIIVPFVHGRAVRLTVRRLEAATPLSMAEIQADKDQLRAEFAMSTRRLEMSVEQLKSKSTGQLAELGKKNDAINRLKIELGEKAATIFALEARDKGIKDQLRATEDELEVKISALRETERNACRQGSRARQGDRRSSPRQLGDLRQPARRDRRAQDAGRQSQGSGRRRWNATSRKPRTATRARRKRAEKPRKELADERGTRAEAGTRVGAARTPARDADHRSRDHGPPHRRHGDAADRAGAPARRPRARARPVAHRCRFGAPDRGRPAPGARAPSSAATAPPPKRCAPRRRWPRASSSARAKTAPSCSAKLSAMKREAEATWASERVENALLRERINDVAAEVARLTAALEGPGSTDRHDPRRTRACSRDQRPPSRAAPANTNERRRQGQPRRSHPRPAGALLAAYPPRRDRTKTCLASFLAALIAAACSRRSRRRKIARSPNAAPPSARLSPTPRSSTASSRSRSAPRLRLAGNSTASASITCRCGFTSTTAPSPTASAQVGEVVADIKIRIANLDIAMTADKSAANVVVRLMRERDFAPHLRQRSDATNAPGFRNRSTRNASRASARMANSASCIPTCSSSPTPATSSFYDCVYEELLQSLGPINDTDKVPWTMFNDDVQMGFFGVYDQYILNILYHPRVRPA